MKKESYKDLEIYTGIDVHKKSWELRSMTADVNLKSVHMTKPSVEKLEKYLKSTYPGAKHYCAYEAGFSGFWLQEGLASRGIDTIIVHPADVPTTDKEKRNKTDRIDCTKLANSLRSKQLTGIYIPTKNQQRHRSLVRLRYQFASDQRRIKNRIKAHLNFYGVEDEQINYTGYWSKNFINELYELGEKLNDSVLLSHLDKLTQERKYVLQSIRKLRELSKTEYYNEKVRLLRSIPGVGLLTAMVFLTELGTDLRRFKRDDNYISYIGFVPKVNASGEKRHVGSLSKRGNKRIRTSLILSAWVAIRYDGSLLMEYQKYKATGKASNKAIIKIAKKIALIMKAVLRDGVKYDVNK